MTARHVGSLALCFALVDASIYDRTRPEPSNKVTIYRKTYATLEDTSPFGVTNQYRSNIFTKLPTGWSVAYDSSEARIAIQLYNFGTDHLILGDKIYDHNLKVVEGQLITDKNLGVKANINVSGRILIEKNRLAPVERRPFESINITNLITYNGRDYAMVNNNAPRDSGASFCDPFFYVLQDGWSVARDDPHTMAVLHSKRFPFGYNCKVLAKGVGYEYFVPKINHNPTCGPAMLKKATINNQEVVGVMGDKCGAVMINRPSRNPSTWSREEPITNTMVVVINDQIHEYAVLDNTPPTKSYISCNGDCCQNVAMRVPSGWEVAHDNMPGYEEAASQPWGTSCTGKELCIPTILDGRIALVDYCDSRVLIKKTSIDQVSWSEWSECSKDCPSVQTRESTIPPRSFTLKYPKNETRECKSDCLLTSSTSVTTSPSVVPPPVVPPPVVPPPVVPPPVVPPPVVPPPVVPPPVVPPPVVTASTTSSSTPVTTTGGVAGATIPSMLAAFAAVACALLF